MWGIVETNFTIVTATAAGMVGVNLMAALQADVGYDLPGVTASAIRLNVSYRQTGAMNGDDDVLSMGIGWVSDTAVTAGGNALPDPSTDHWDWMFHDSRALTASGTADADQVARNGFFTIKNDSMRKQRENHSSLTIVVRATILQSTTVQVFVGGRILYLLP